MTKSWKAFLVLAAVLILAGLRMGQFAEWTTDVPLPAQWTTEAAGLYGPWLHRTSLANGAWHLLGSADTGARVWKLMVLRINGQWDPRVLDFANVLLFGLAIALFLACALAWAEAGAALVIFLATVGFLCLPVAVNEGLGAPSAWVAIFVLLSALHLASATARPGSRRWYLGHLAGLANVLSSTIGLVSPLSILAWMALRRDRSEDKAVRRAHVVLANGVLAAAGLAIIASGRPGAPHFHFAHFFATAAWPFSWRAGALIIAAPAIALLASPRAATDSMSRSLPFACLAACWAIASTAAIAAGATPGGAASPVLICVVLAVQGAALLALPAERARARTLKALAMAIWLTVIFNGIAHQRSPVDYPTDRARDADAEASAIRHYVADRRIADLAAAFPGTGRAKQIGTVLSDPAMVAILPPSLRPSLPMTASAGTQGFRRGATPQEDGKPVLLPAWGTSGIAHAEPNARFASVPLETAAPLLQIHIAGLLDPPANSLALKTQDGRIIPPITPRTTTGERWQTVNFRPPPGPFTVVASQADPSRPLAFSAPIEATEWPRVAKAACAAWGSIMICGLVLALLGGFAGVAAWQQDSANAEFRRSLAVHGPWLALFAYAIAFVGSLDTSAAGSDSSGYLNIAKLFLRGHLHLPPRWIPGVSTSLDMLTPLGFAVRHGAIVPSYPAGFPLMIAAVGRLISLPLAIPLVIFLHFILGVVVTERLARVCGLSRVGALAAAAVVALCPIYIFSGLQPMSDMPTLVWVTAALYFALSSRTRPSAALFAGAACGVAVLLRPANVICLLPVAVALGLSRGRLLRWAIGGLPPAILWVAYNFRLYGNPLVTGYGNPGYLFSLGWVLPSAGNYLRTVTFCLSPLIWIAVAGPWARRLTIPARGALAACAVCYLGFYAFYSCTHESWWILRFVLPAFPALAILAIGVAESVLQALARKSRRLASSLAALLAAAALAGLLQGCFELPMLEAARDNGEYRDVSRWIDRTSPRNAVIIAYQVSGSLFYYTEHPILRAGRTTQPAANHVIRALLKAGTPVYAVIFPQDDVTSIGLMPDSWTEVAAFGSTKVWKLSESRPLTPSAARSAGSGTLFGNTAGQIGPGRHG